MLADGRRFRILLAIDDFTCECLALVVDTWFGTRIAKELDAVTTECNAAQMTFSDNATTTIQ